MRRDPPHDRPVEARGLVKRYGDLAAVDGVDLTVEAGDVYGYLGPNGAGKTTSLRMLLGLIRPTSGEARLFGRDPLVWRRGALEGVAGFVEAPQFYPYLTGRKNLELLAAYDGRDARADRRGARHRRPRRPGRRPCRRLLARHAPAARHRRVAPPQPAPSAARRTADGPRPCRDARHEGPDPRPLGAGHHRAPLEPSDGRRRGAVQPRGDRRRGRILYEGDDRRPDRSAGAWYRLRASDLDAAQRVAGESGWPTSRARTASCASVQMRSCSSGS